MLNGMRLAIYKNVILFQVLREYNFWNASAPLIFLSSQAL